MGFSLRGDSTYSKSHRSIEGWVDYILLFFFPEKNEPKQPRD